MAETKKPAPAVKKESKKPVSKDGLLEVKNITNKTLNLSKGQIAPGKTGKATRAEFSYLFNYLTRV